MNQFDILKLSQISRAREGSGFKDGIAPALIKCLEGGEGNQLEVLRGLIESGTDLNARDHRNQTALMIACSKGKLEVVKVLLSNGADTRLTDRQQRTALMLSLIGQGADPINIIKLLHSHGANLMSADINNSTALHFAANYGHSESVQYLLSNNVNQNAVDNDKNTPLQLANKNERKRCIELLIKANDKRECIGKIEDEPRIINLNGFKREEGCEHRTERGIFVRGNSSQISKAGICSKCCLEGQVFCENCASELVGIYKEAAVEKSRLEDSLKTALAKLKGYEKENTELKEALQKKIKAKISTLHLTSANVRTSDSIMTQLRLDISQFITEQKRWSESVDEQYSALTNLFKDFIKSTIKNSSVDLFGSYSTGLLLPYSDIDLVITHTDLPIKVLSDLNSNISALNSVKSTENIFTAAIPVMKVLAETCGLEVKIDITVGDFRHKGLECIALIKKFMGKYPGIRGVFLVLKQLMYFCGFHEPFKGGISSYGLFLLVVYFYQHSEGEILNKGREAEGLVGFLEFFCRYDWKKCVIVEYENWDYSMFKGKHCRGPNVPDPLNPANNAMYNIRLDKFIVRNRQYILQSAYGYVFKWSFCECEECMKVLGKMMYETRSNALCYPG